MLTPGNQVKETTYHKSVIRNIPWSPSYASLVHISGDSVLTELPNSWRLFRDRTTADIVASHLQRHNVQRSSTTPTRAWFQGYRDCRRAGDVHPNPGPHQEHRLGRPAPRGFKETSATRFRRRVAEASQHITDHSKRSATRNNASHCPCCGQSPPLPRTPNSARVHVHPRHPIPQLPPRPHLRDMGPNLPNHNPNPTNTHGTQASQWNHAPVEETKHIKWPEGWRAIFNHT